MKHIRHNDEILTPTHLTCLGLLVWMTFIQGCCTPKYQSAVHTVYAQAEVAALRCDVVTEEEERSYCFEQAAIINVQQMHCLAQLVESETCDIEGD